MTCSKKLSLVVAVALVAGCSSDDTVNPAWAAICNAFCEQGAQCFPEASFGACVSTCTGELAPFECKGNEAAIEACVADMSSMPCWAIEQGQLPQSCDDVCLCQTAEDCDDENACTVGVCNAQDGSCGETLVADGLPCGGEAGICESGRCVMECSEAGIRTAIIAGGGPYVFDCNGPMTVTTEDEIVIDNDVVLDGEGNLTVDADGNHRVFSVSPVFRPIAELHNMTITGGAGEEHGGGISNFGTLTVDSCTVAGNSAGSGGGISNSGILTLSNSFVSENTATFGGGGVDSDEVLLVANSRISDNRAELGGGLWNRASATVIDTTVERNTIGGGYDEGGGSGILNASNMTLVGSTVSENVSEASFDGEGLASGSLTMVNSTVSGNVGGGIRITGNATIVSSTVANDVGDASAIRNDGQLSLRNTVILGRCEGRPADISEGGNVASPGRDCGLNHPTDQTISTAGELDLGPLQDNGGPTFTHDLGSRSPAIDAVAEGECVDADGLTLMTDQRGEARPEGPRCDAGAVESSSVFGPEFTCDEEGIREAVEIAGGPHTFACEGPTTVTTSAEILINESVILDGEGVLTIDGVDSHRIFTVSGETVELRGMTLTGGRATGGSPQGNGGAIWKDSSRLTLVDVTLSGNRADGEGGAIYARIVGELIITDSTLSGNTSGVDGGAILTDTQVMLTRSTVSGNDAGRDGGGIAIRGASADVVLTNSTVSGNSAGDAGGGIQQRGGTLTLTHSTLAQNTAPVGPAIEGFLPVTFASSIIEDGCSLALGLVTSQGHNVESPGNTCGLDPLLDDQVDVTDVSLAPLDDNGGPTRTHLPSPTSPAVNAIPAGDCSVPTDQRGVARPQGSGCDVGAVEVEAP